MDEVSVASVRAEGCGAAGWLTGVLCMSGIYVFTLAGVGELNLSHYKLQIYRASKETAYRESPVVLIERTQFLDPARSLTIEIPGAALREE